MRDLSVRRVVAIAAPSVGVEEWEALREPIESGWLTAGPKVDEFERAFAERHSVRHAVGVSSCTTGLHLALAALDVGPGDEVIVPAFTWVATANAVLHCGATPVFVDVDPTTFNISPAAVADALTVRTRAIIPVHLFGLCADMEAIRNLAPPHVRIIEDAACAAGSEYRGRPAGGLGDAAVFSFHARKTITTGEGGMLTTDDDALMERARRLRNHGAAISEETRHAGPAPYLLPDFDDLGYNYRLTDLQAALGLVQLRKLDTLIDEREQWARWYRTELADLDWLQMPAVPIEGRHGWQSFVTVVRPGLGVDRNALMMRLHEAGIATRPGTHAPTELGLYRRLLGLRLGQFSTAAMLARQSLALPLHNRMTADDYEYVSDALHEA